MAAGLACQASRWQCSTRFENTHCCEIALLASALLDSMASLVVDVAYVHHGTAAASADNINGWSEAVGKDKAEGVQRRPASALGFR